MLPRDAHFGIQFATKQTFSYLEFRCHEIGNSDDLVGPDNWTFSFMCSASMTQQLVIKILTGLTQWTVP